MRVGLIGFLSSFAAIPLAYFPFKYNYLDKKITTENERPGHRFEKKPLDLDTSNWFDWIYKFSWDDNISDDVSIRRERSSFDDFKQGLIGYLGTYIFFKIFARVTRTLTMLFIMGVLLYVMLNESMICDLVIV